MRPLSASIEERLAQAKAELVDRILLGVLFIALLGVPFSLIRLSVTGWLPLYALHLLLGTLAISIYVLRRRLPTRAKMVLILGLFGGVGIGGLVQLGPLGAGAWWLALSSLLAGVFFSLRVGLLFLAGTTVFLLLVGLGYAEGWLSLSFDANTYTQRFSAWVTLLIATILMPMVVFAALRGRDQTIVALLREVEQQSEIILQLANHDELTGLPNRALGMEQLHEVLAGNNSAEAGAALMFIDLDGFKAINDTWGHDAGDEVLRQVADRLLSRRPLGTQAARLGGDEFILFFSPVIDAGQARTVANQLLEDLHEPIRHQGQELKIGASIGIALYPQHAQTVTALLQAADQAMYAAKSAGKNQLAIHSSAA